MRVYVGEVLEKTKVVLSQDHVPIRFDIGTSWNYIIVAYGSLSN